MHVNLRNRQMKRMMPKSQRRRSKYRLTKGPKTNSTFCLPTMCIVDSSVSGPTALHMTIEECNSKLPSPTQTQLFRGAQTGRGVGPLAQRKNKRFGRKDQFFAAAITMHSGRWHDRGVAHQWGLDFGPYLVDGWAGGWHL